MICDGKLMFRELSLEVRIIGDTCEGSRSDFIFCGCIDDWSQLAGRTQKECYAVRTIAKKFCVRFKQIDSRAVKSRKSWNVKVISLLYQGMGIPK